MDWISTDWLATTSTGYCPPYRLCAWRELFGVIVFVIPLANAMSTMSINTIELDIEFHSVCSPGSLYFFISSFGALVPRARVITDIRAPPKSV